MKISVPDIANGIVNTIWHPREHIKGAAKVERHHMSKVLMISMISIIFICALISLFLHFADPVYGAGDLYVHLRNIVDNILALLFVVVILDSIVAYNAENRRRRDEMRAIIRQNRIIQPLIDMYLVRKNMVITPNDRTVRKFQVDARFTVNDMRDMYGPSELISDVGKSKLESYRYYQSMLQTELIHLVETIDFTFYPELCESAMKYINSTSYGASALEAVIEYQTAKTGTKSMKTMVIGMIREESGNGRFSDANPVMKNVYLLQQTINDQELAIKDYLENIRTIQAEEPKEKKQFYSEYE